tara:strand:- start:2937 stop:3809 length:873 start_codon:yes stop_codon:yes gene_type:complete
MDEHCLSIIKSSKFLKYLQNIGIETDVIISTIFSEFNRGTFNNFINNHEKKLSPNIYIENLVFTQVCKYLNDNYIESFLFENNGKIDIKSIIAHSKSLIQRPDITIPFESDVGFKEPDNLNGFIRIARFEHQLAERTYSTDNTKQETVLFEGLLPIKMQTNPLYCQNSSDDIWNNIFCFGEPIIQAIYPNLHSIEAPNVLWINSELLEMLDLTLDTYKNGLRALDSNQEAVLIYRQWREELIGNGASLAGTNANIARLKGCDLILREDCYQKLKDIIPNVVFYTDLLNSR